MSTCPHCGGSVPENTEELNNLHELIRLLNEERKMINSENPARRLIIMHVAYRLSSNLHLDRYCQEGIDPAKFPRIRVSLPDLPNGQTHEVEILLSLQYPLTIEQYAEAVQALQG
jgi:hypothetical protein